jgi:hypothetical protein
MNGHLETTEWLVKEGGSDLTARNNLHQIPLDSAKVFQRKEVMLFLWGCSLRQRTAEVVEEGLTTHA